MKQRLPIAPTVVAAYREWWRLLWPLRGLLRNAVIISIAISAVAEFVPQRLWDNALIGTAIGLIQDAVWALLFTPILVAIHRFVIRDEVTRVYTFAAGEPAFRLFLLWLFALKVLSGLPFDFLGLLQAFGLSLAATSLGLVAALIVAIAVALRLTILLPAIAVQAPGATAARAMADTKDQALRLLAIFVVALIPWIAAVVAGVMVLGRGVEVTGSPAMMASLVMGGVSETITLSLTAVIAALAFVALARDVNRAAAVSPGAA
jgi:hypothetical protein